MSPPTGTFEITEATRLLLYQAMLRCPDASRSAPTTCSWRASSRAPPTWAWARKPWPPGFATALRPDDMSFATYRGHNHMLLRGMSMASILGRVRPAQHRLLRGQGRVDAHHRRHQGRHGLLRHRRRPPAGGRGGGLGRSGAGHRAGLRVLLRRRHHQHRDLPRGGEPGRHLEAAGGLRLREQPLHGVHRDLGGDPRAVPRRRPGRRPTASTASSWTATTSTPSTRSRWAPSAGPGAARAPRWWRPSPTATRATPGPTRASTAPTRRWPPGWRGIPLPLYRARLEGLGFPASVLDEMERLVLAEVDEATDAVRAASPPDPGTLLTDLWANGGSQWRN